MLSRQGRARIIVAGAAAVVAAVFAAAPAHAQVLSWTVSPGGAASASTGTVLSDNGIDISCTDSSADASLNTAAT
ncbi:MAG: hypothetical protein J2P15_21345, partial [Micromonosporaceae bacterium]|nr:hypothetical protein [Micromonosporaceae bacterium]